VILVVVVLILEGGSDGLDDLLRPVALLDLGQDGDERLGPFHGKKIVQHGDRAGNVEPGSRMTRAFHQGINQGGDLGGLDLCDVHCVLLRE